MNRPLQVTVLRTAATPLASYPAPDQNGGLSIRSSIMAKAPLTPQPAPEERDDIIVRGAETHNLKTIDVAIPRGALTVVSGVSGSGKSSLAFDTLYAEGQRRYVETLSTYARQFLHPMPKPPVGSISNIPPAVALRQGSSISNAKSTVATLTELLDHLQVLFARAGEVVCKACGSTVVPFNVPRTVEWLQQHARGERVLIVATARPNADGMGDLLRQLIADGYQRAWLEGEVVEIESEASISLVRAAQVEVIIDRLAVEDDALRLREALEAAFKFAEGAVSVVFWDRETEGRREQRTFHRGWVCSGCGTAHKEPMPSLFHPFNALGACGRCEGFGRSVGLDPYKTVPDPTLTLERGALAIFDIPSARRPRKQLLEWCMAEGIAIDIPWLRLSQANQNRILYGDKGWGGAAGWLEEILADRTLGGIRFHAMRYRSFTVCSECQGSGLNADARAVRIAGLHLGNILALRIDEALLWAQAIALAPALQKALERLITEVRERLGYLAEAGLGYLTLMRQAKTLSGGEIHRVILATSLGRMLTDTLYVLDEPTAGLHPHDTERMMQVVEKLRDIGNTVVVVEHDPDVIRRAQHVVELGPFGGDRGGEVLFSGTVEGLQHSATPTGELLRKRSLTFTGTAPSHSSVLTIKAAHLHNIQGVEVHFPHGGLTVVTGVSGSGKSTLVHDLLYAHLESRRGSGPADGLPPAEVTGDIFSEVVMVDQSSISRSSRSSALTFSGAYSVFRDMYAALPDSNVARLTASHFSFNVAGGRCERCEGAGVLSVEMVFFADVEIPCDVCEGRRFTPAVLAPKLRGLSIDQLFECTVQEALERFSDSGPVTRRLEPLARVGLGYIRLGQSTTQMSGGELQRLKLASYLGQSTASNAAGALFIFDEPTVGLHMRDVEQLVDAMRQLTAMGHTVIVVEHNLDLVAASDWVVDMGPGAGPDGGAVVYQGPVEGLLSVDGSRTGFHLRETFA